MKKRFNDRSSNFLSRYSVPTRLYVIALALMAVFLLVRKAPSYKTVRNNKLSYDIIDIPDEPLYTADSEKMPVPWAVSYSPFTAHGACKTARTVGNDLREIKSKGISAVRVFSTDCNILQSLDWEPELRLILGVHPYARDETKPELPQYIQSLTVQLEEIADWGKWSRLDMLVVGSQGVFAEEYSRAQLVKMIRHVKQHVQVQPGFKGLVTTVEPVQSWVSPTKYNAASIDDYKKFLREQEKASNPITGIENVEHATYDDNGDLIEDTDLCAVVDVVSLVVQPYFNAAMYSDEAGRLISRDVRFARYFCSDEFIGRAHFDDAQGIEEIDTAAPTPPIVVLEAGWPSDGDGNGNAMPGNQEQKMALRSMIMARDTHSNKRIPSVIYSYFDELWRDAGDLKVEQSFGISKHY